MLSVKVVRAADGSMNPSGKEEIRNIARTEPQQEGQVGSDDAVNSPQPDAGCRPVPGGGVLNGGFPAEQPTSPCVILREEEEEEEEVEKGAGTGYQRRELARVRNDNTTNSNSISLFFYYLDPCISFLDSQAMKKDRKPQTRACTPLPSLERSPEGGCNSLNPPKSPELACQGSWTDQQSLLPPEGFNGDPCPLPLPSSPPGMPDSPDPCLLYGIKQPPARGHPSSLDQLEAFVETQETVEVLEEKQDRELKSFPTSALLSSGRSSMDSILTLLQRKCGNGRINLCPVVQLIDITKDLGRLSRGLQTSSVRLDCGGWSEAGSGGEELLGESGGESTELLYSFHSTPSLANGIRSPGERLHKRPRIGPKGRRQHLLQWQLELQKPTEIERPPQSEGPKTSPEPEPEPEPEAEPARVAQDPSPVRLEVPSEIQAPPEPLPYKLPLSPATSQQVTPECHPNTAVTTTPSTAAPAETVSTPPESQQSSTERGQNPSASTPNRERKYALRSSDRPKIPCHLRKSSRLRRALEEVHKDVKETTPKEESVETPEKTPKPKEVEAAGEKEEVCEEKKPPGLESFEALPRFPTPSEGAVREGSSTARGRRKGKCVGIRKIVVKVARIPVNMSRRHKSYKISSMETPAQQDRAGETEGGEGPQREPTALLKMKNNGKNVMVMFPPGKQPVILKRRRGRPPKQVPPEQSDPKEVKTEEGKKPRRRRRVKLPSPQPSYANDTNDAKTDYGDVLSKLAFLNREPPTTGRCSPPRCSTPSEPETLQQPLDTPNISSLLQRLQGFRRRGGRAGCMGGRGGLAGSAESFKRSFSDFFETIGKKRKTPTSDPDHPRKRGKAAMGDPSSIPSAEKVFRKRRPRKNGFLKEPGAHQDLEWASGNGWASRADGRASQADFGYQKVALPRGFAPCDPGKVGYYPSQAQGNPESQGLCAGYFRSLLDSDDSSDLLDCSLSSSSGASGRAESRKVPGCYEAGNPTQSQRWCPGYPKRGPKASPSNCEGPSQTSNPPRPPYSHGGNYNLSQTSPTSFQKLVPPLSLSRSPSSPHPSGSFPQYSGYGSGSQSNLQPLKQYEGQRTADCSFPYAGSGNSKALQASPSSSSHVGYSGHQGTNPLGKSLYGGFPSPGAASPGSFMLTKNTANSFPLSPESCRQYSQWGHRPSYPGSGNTEAFGLQYLSSFDYSACTEPKDILDISNYTPQKAKQRSFSETFSESSSDSSHFGQPGAAGSCKLQDHPASGEGQSSLSSLEKLMMDWNESSSGPSYSWNQSVLFQGGSKPGRGRRKRTDAQGESCLLGFPPVSTPSSSSSPIPGTKRSATGARQPRGSRGAFPSCRRDRAALVKPKAQKPAAQASAMPLYQDSPNLVVDYYSGDSSSMSPLSSQSQSMALGEREQCGYSSPYSVNPPTPSSSEDKFLQMFHSEAACLSPVVGLQPDPKPFHAAPTKPLHPYAGPPKAFSPSCSPTLAFNKDNPLPCDFRRLLPCAAQSPHRASKDLPGSQYDSPTYSSSSYWYQQPGGSLSGSPHHYDKREEFVERTGAAGSPQILNPISLGRTEKEKEVENEALEMGKPQRPAAAATTHSSSSYPPALELNSHPSASEPGFHLPPESFQHRYPPLQSQGQTGLWPPPHRGVLSHLLDQHTEDLFTVTSL
ncbi:AT-hook DNA-binding motif-containing protein 1 isoform X1 [Huso huso]|uniref:AT-hook DNA-binding motif-containing protein 1 isoform X1 n=1 Tax=Huso huso TaxID=61971 RepID=A0ABR0YNG1_HUSHU